MNPWKYPQYAWQSLRMGFAGPFLNHTLLITIDSYGKWAEVILVRSMNTNITVRVIMPIFSTHSIPEHVVTYDGGAFKSEKWKRFIA